MHIIHLFGLTSIRRSQRKHKATVCSLFDETKQVSEMRCRLAVWVCCDKTSQREDTECHSQIIKFRSFVVTPATASDQ